MDRDVPLVVPEVNADALAQIKKGIIANPNCSTIQLVVALKPLNDEAKIKRVVVSTYQSVSGAGKEAMDELFTQTRAGVRRRPDRRRQVHTNRSRSMSFRISTSSWIAATPAKNSR
ncbi:MAG: Asd/ArgC dimerization domain-containing protein [Rhizomicrobium sp.]